MNGGEKDWLTEPVRSVRRNWDLGAMPRLAVSQDFALERWVRIWRHDGSAQGRVGFGQCAYRTGFRCGRLVAVNAIGSAVIGEGPHFWAAPYEQGSEFGGRAGRKEFSA